MERQLGRGGVVERGPSPRRVSRAVAFGGGRPLDCRKAGDRREFMLARSRALAAACGSVGDRPLSHDASEPVRLCKCPRGRTMPVLGGEVYRDLCFAESEPHRVVGDAQLDCDCEPGCCAARPNPLPSVRRRGGPLVLPSLIDHEFSSA